MGSRPSADTNAWPALRVVARMHGSLPMGGVAPLTPVHAFETTPDALRRTSSTGTPTATGRAAA